ncbi:MAG TPA: hypothetical protein VGO47_07880 [Chlamydiales bacterium]|nr:hypothetical protein [Chlamydiales bacterium]
MIITIEKLLTSSLQKERPEPTADMMNIKMAYILENNNQVGDSFALGHWNLKGGV